MPQLSRFYGIIIYLYFKDHSPPHFHAWYGGSKCEIGIESLEVIAGTFPNRALALVREWAELHKDELITSWNQAVDGKPFLPIEPLP